MSELKLPRVLIVGGPYASQAATLTTLRNLLSALPRDHLAQVFFSEEGQPYLDGLAGRLYRIPWSRQPLYGPLRQAKQRFPDSGSKLPSAGQAGRGRDSGLKQCLRQGLSALADVSPVIADDILRRIVAEFQPDVLYSLMGSGRFMELLLRLSRISRRPIVPHIMDDWPSTIYDAGGLAGVARRVMLGRLRRVFDRSPMILCISKAMRREYQERFGRPCRAFMNCVDTGLVDMNTVRGESQPFVFCYVGNLEYGRAELVARFLQIASGLKLRRSVRLRVYCSDLSAPVQKLLEQSGSVELLGALRDHQIRSLRAEVDAFLHFDGFDGEARRFFRLSLSTKIPLYLSAGLPILASGPVEAGTMQWIYELHAGLCVYSSDAKKIGQAIARLVDDSRMRCEMGRRARQAAIDNHDRAEQSRLFVQTLAEISGHLVRVAPAGEAVAYGGG